MPEINITAVVESFAKELVAAVEASVAKRVQAAVAAAFDAPQKRGPGRPRKQVAQARLVAPVAVEGAVPAVATKQRQSSPKAIRARKLQGQYMGALKSLKGADRERVRLIAKEKSVAEALKLALSLKKTNPGK
jgi:hypothetical protein